MFHFCQNLCRVHTNAFHHHAVMGNTPFHGIDQRLWLLENLFLHVVAVVTFVRSIMF
ncbi:Uncharacterised protein [Vibrio cholerae]|uniref:Uncharacterized protein n=1 Tax=Vibrio cholerae TaxID=666 RepID=A0A655Y5L5_VIBCL|nr:Uncharacterised protein [Vibrio cholerae]CSA76272.1 Uncharacterised protein [Vibrio cholerae]CSB63474.1 Uncharacterised protein [Vibrio cholerae]CSC29196.1 Uncharacterised protein [Vibrio cholerae]CSD29003.1 Uncharacterised protein [Vibrio cholerae]